MALADRPRLPPLAVAGVLLALPAPSHAETGTFGSDLTNEANVVEHHGADSAFWNIALAGGQQTAAPAEGQVTRIRVKGTVLKSTNPNDPEPIPMIHFQVLHPMGDGTVLVELSSGDFFTPLGGDPQQIRSYEPVNLCVHRGDYVDFNDIGGFEWRYGNYSGMPFQVFSRVPGSRTNFYTADNGTNVGTRWAPQETKENQELLMQMVLATAEDATDVCPGGYKEHVFRGLQVVSGQTAMLRTNAHQAKVRASCHGENYGACKGTLTLKGEVRREAVDLATAAFDIPSGGTTNIDVEFSKESQTLVQQQGGPMDVIAIADARDDPRGDPRAQSSVPVQTRTSSTKIKLDADKYIGGARAPCIAPKLTGRTLSSAKKLIKRAGCAVGRITRRRVSRSRRRGRVLKQSLKPRTVKPGGYRIKLVLSKH